MPDSGKTEPSLTAGLPDGVHGIGSLEIPYAYLVEVLGEPTDRDDTALRGDGKIRCMWILRQGGAVIGICDWKRNNAARWLHPEMPVENVTEWLVLGDSAAEADYVLGGSGVMPAIERRG
jgi:hypothetical protein